MIGSREWMNISHGTLSFKEKIQLIKQVLVPATLNYTKTFIEKPSTKNTFQLADIQIPDTPIVKEAIAELENTGNQAIIIHGVVIFGALLLLKINNGNLMKKVY